MNLLSLVLAVFSFQAIAAPKVTYFKCKVQEEEVKVTVKFAIKGFDSFKEQGTLITYPGIKDQDQGMVYVRPKSYGPKKYSPYMANLNGQGGDLRIRDNGDIYLFGDGAGYQFTDLVLWNDNSEDRAYTEGYVRDYGPSHGKKEYFKQFITCEKSDKIL